MRRASPKLRFTGFKEDFKYALLKEIVEEDRKIRYGIVQPGEYDPEGRYMIRGQDYSSVNGWADISNFFRVSDAVESKYLKARVKGGDLLITIVGAGTGWVEVVPEFLDGANITQTTGRIAIDKTKASSIYVKNYLLSIYGKKEIYKYIKGQAQPGLNIGDVEIFRLALPSLPEQQKIASFLSAVDEKIQQLTRKKDLLEQYKKGVMQQLFSGKLRFKDENGKAYPKWEEKRLEHICSFFSGGTPQSTNKKYYSGSIPFIGSGNIYDNEVTTFISEEALKNSSAKLVVKGDLLFALYGANSGEVAISKISGAINQAVLCIRTTENTVYLYSLLHYNQRRIVSRYLQGGQGNLSAEIVRKLKYKFPSLVEQQKIASFLTALDTKIESVAAQIAHIQTFKKGLLQQMFV